MRELENRPLAGLAWMLVTGALFVAVTAIVKHVGDTVPPPQAAFLRYALGLVFLLPVLGALRREGLGPGSFRLFAMRGAVHTVAVMLWFFAMTQIPIAEVTAMNYLSPVYVALGAMLFLGERMAFRRIAAIVAALVGVAMILRPGFREVTDGHLAMLVVAVMFAVSYLVAKNLSGRASPAMIVTMLSVTVTVGLAPFAAAVWVTPRFDQVAWLSLVAAFATAGHYTMTLAFRAAPVTVTQPVTFLQLIWAALLGWAVFDEALDPWVLAGGAVIVASVSVIAWREAVAARREADAARITRAGRRIVPDHPHP
jgi:drug/metabolite transporter (DMT)-like permease